MSFYEEVPSSDRRRSNRYRNCKLYLDTETNLPILGTREISKIKTRNTDLIHTVQYNESLRLDLLAHRYYNNALLWWVIAQANGLKDPIQGVPPGSKIRIPSIESLYEDGGLFV